ncbi:enhanced intracellular survival protein Eis [Paenibacillus sp. J2TS4]|uniref:GNAT family N-acetyltransferase n=1 Tax=Paenibacillus sp. J2TS4 TaxID=2807194 RepID=UPI001B0CB640|nr:GNAT family N-acetyltransferase [Paenibacillus sp. J2TS4]GIP31059.1 GNAT family acetyltransferase [Paenibacillus sp. J2TS4]
MEMIRQLNREELAESIKLSEFAFQYELSSEQRAERMASTKPEDQWGYFIDGKLAAKMTIHPMTTWINGRKMKFGGVASVATWPEYRRKGMVGKLLVNALHIMREQGQTLACLHPFEFPFYRKFGWETYVEYKEYELEAKHLPHYFTIDGRVERTEDRDLIKKLYAEYAEAYNGMLERTNEWWEIRFWKNKGSVVVFYNETGKPAGYLQYHVADSIMTVHDFVCLHEKARASLWKFIANHDSMIRSVKLKAPADDPLPFILQNPRFKQETIPYFMARVVDAEAFLREYKFTATGRQTRLTLALEDSHAPWNHQVFTVEISGAGEANIRPSGSLPEGSGMERNETGGHELQKAAADLSCDIQTLTAMLIGYRSPELMHAIGRLQGSEAMVKEWAERLTSQTPYLMDYY